MCCYTVVYKFESKKNLDNLNETFQDVYKIDKSKFEADVPLYQQVLTVITTINSNNVIVPKWYIYLHYKYSLFRTN